MTAEWTEVEYWSPVERPIGKPTVKVNADKIKRFRYFMSGIFFFVKSKYNIASVPASADLPKVINAGERPILFSPSAILVAGAVIENSIIPTNAKK